MNKHFIILLLVTALLLPGCSKYGYVNLNYPLDPVVVLPEGIRTIAVVNRSLSREEDKQKNLLEAIATAEIAGSDKVASDECLKGAFDKVAGRNSIAIVIPHQTRLYGSGSGVTPELLDWRQVKTICDSSDADALLVLETFDSNSDLLVAAVTQHVGDILQGTNPKPAPPSQVRMTVRALWRLYDPATKRILDQHQSTSLLVFDAPPNNIAIPPPDALPRTAYAAGQEYMDRFLPGYYTVKRDMYKKGKGSAKDEFRAVFRRAETANWEGAIEGWTALLNKTNGKNAGRAALNIAVAYEVLGKTEQALEWAKKSYEDYGDKLGREYAKILLKRKRIEN